MTKLGEWFAKHVAYVARHRRLTIGGAVFVASIAALFSLDAVLPPNLALYQHPSVEVRAMDGRLLRAFTTKDGQWRLITRPQDVDPRYIEFLEAYEDKRFNSNFGVDPEAVVRAALQWASAGHVVSGASTLTMQAARLLEPGRPRTIPTKLIQMARALQLEQRFTKNKILSIYLTLAPFGGNLEGVRAASLAYFGKEPAHLTIAEAALLVALPQSPEHLRPDRSPKAARAGRDKVLRRLASDGVIGPDELADALKQGVPQMRLPMPFHAPRLARELYATAGARHIIRTPIDYDRQIALEGLADNEARWFPDGSAMAALVIENKTRRVKAYLGGVDFWGPAGQVDLARSLRSPGSALKPFIYGLAFDDLPLHPETIMLDAPMTFGDYAPQNFDKEFQGMVSVRHALQWSLNVPAVAVLDKLSPIKLAALLKRGGAHLVFPGAHEEPGLPLALGGVGITLFDLAKLYVALADKGLAANLVTDLAQPPGPEVRLISARSAWYVEDILRGSPMPDGWSQGIGIKRMHQVAFKTGTSYGYRDAWAVGYSPRYTVAVWVGRADGSARVEQVGRNTAAPLVFRIFDLLPAEPEDKAPPPADALVVSSAQSLPAPMRRFFANPQRPPKTELVHTAAPQIAYPPNGATVSIGASPQQRRLELRASGGDGSLRWIVNGRLLPRAGFLQPTIWTAPGPGFAHIVVVDGDGRAAAADVRLKLGALN